MTLKDKIKDLIKHYEIQIEHIVNEFTYRAPETWQPKEKRIYESILSCYKEFVKFLNQIIKED